MLFSFASGIFHPYYVSLLAPFLAALVGAGAGQLFGRRLSLRVVAPLAIAAGVVVELVIRGNYPAQLHWLVPVLVGLGVLTIAVLALARSPRARAVALAVAIAALLIAPAVWAFDTLSYATSSTFPSGGPAIGRERRPGLRRRRPRPPPARRRRRGRSRPRAVRLGSSSGSGAGAGGSGVGGPRAPVRRRLRRRRAPLGAAQGGGSGAGGGGFGGSPFGGNAALAEHRPWPTSTSHGGGTLAVSSQSGAAEAIIARGANVVGIGGFSGRESEVSRSWLAQEVRSGKIRWVLAEESGPGPERRGAGGSGGARRAGRDRLPAGLLVAAARRRQGRRPPAAKPAWAPKR